MAEDPKIPVDPNIIMDAAVRPITPVEVYYLLQRFCFLQIWDVFNLEPAGDKTLLKLPGTSPHFNVYDRGSCIVGAPKDLFSSKRTLGDALDTARAMADDVYKRGWTIEFSGFNKMCRAAWVQLQVLSSRPGAKPAEILHYNPSMDDLKLAQTESITRGPSASI